jgi:DNA-binding MarR family transcriptional regulator
MELQITVGAASKLVDRLERAGLAVRSAHPSDRRSMLIALTEAGQLCYAQAAAAAQAELEHMLSPILDQNRVAELARTLIALRTELKENQ